MSNTRQGIPEVLDTINTELGRLCVHRLDKVIGAEQMQHLPMTIKILLENVLRHAEGNDVTPEQIEALRTWTPQATTMEVAFSPSRVILQDFTGVPALVDLAAMRNAMSSLGADPALINPLIPVDLVIDHSVMVDRFGSDQALDLNRRLEFERNRERYAFLKWGQQALDGFRVVPPGTGIVHQVNLEYLADVVTVRTVDGRQQAFPDTLVGTDSHTTMINALGVLGWGVGGIEAEAAMLGQPISLRLPKVVGFELTGKLPVGTTATDLVLVVTEQLRAHGVVGCFVEFMGAGVAELSLADRATLSNMCPEYGATCGLFPIDAETVRYLQLTGRDPARLALVEQYARLQGLWFEPGMQTASYNDQLALDLGTVRTSLAGPKRPQDRVALPGAVDNFRDYLLHEAKIGQDDVPEPDESYFDTEGGGTAIGQDTTPRVSSVEVSLDGKPLTLRDGHVVIAAITSCTNTSNPSVMVAAGLLARNAVARGLRTQPWVKTSLAPGSQVVPAYLEKAGLMEPLQSLGFHIVGFGCTTCIGNSGPLPEEISDGIRKGKLVAAAVLSGNRNFEGRIHGDVRANYLASPPLVVAYALAGSMLVNLDKDPLGEDADGKAVYLRDIWPDAQEITETVAATVSDEMFRSRYQSVFDGSREWKSIQTTSQKTYDWPDSSYVRKPPFFDALNPDVPDELRINAARCLVKLGDSITTDHISPAGAIRPDSPAGQYLSAQGISPGDFNSLGSRRGNHEVMMRGTFANLRLRNQLVPGSEGSVTRYFPTGETMNIYDAGMAYRKAGIPLIVLAGREYGTGSSRDWAAKGTRLLGVSAVIAESYERIHRSNLVGFGVLPLQFPEDQTAKSLGLSGHESFSIDSVISHPEEVEVHVRTEQGDQLSFTAMVRIDTATEWQYYRHGGILHFVLRKLAAGSAGASASL